jgi:hypothetical protein
MNALDTTNVDMIATEYIRGGYDWESLLDTASCPVTACTARRETRLSRRTL